MIHKKQTQIIHKITNNPQQHQYSIKTEKKSIIHKQTNNPPTKKQLIHEKTNTPQKNRQSINKQIIHKQNK